jgi:hypothetical protein
LVGTSGVSAVSIGRAKNLRSRDKRQNAYLEGGSFGHFGSIFTGLGRFRPFSGADFSILGTFPTSEHGILDPRMAP